MLLPDPTIELVNMECDAFDRDPSNRLTEEALDLLLSDFPENVELVHVLLKVVALNELYSTNIFSIEKVARHVAELHVDTFLANGSLEVVDKIANVMIEGKIRNNFSFATKYCNWHNRAAYPMYDGNAVTCLVWYKDRDSFADFEDDDNLRYSKTFFDVVDKFRDHYGLNSFTFKQLDKFLWRFGKRIKRGEFTRSSPAAP